MATQDRLPGLGGREYEPQVYLPWDELLKTLYAKDLTTPQLGDFWLRNNLVIDVLEKLAHDMEQRSPIPHLDFRFFTYPQEKLHMLSVNKLEMYYPVTVDQRCERKRVRTNLKYMTETGRVKDSLEAYALLCRPLQLTYELPGEFISRTFHEVFLVSSTIDVSRRKGDVEQEPYLSLVKADLAIRVLRERGNKEAGTPIEVLPLFDHRGRRTNQYTIRWGNKNYIRLLPLNLYPEEMEEQIRTLIAESGGEDYPRYIYHR